MHYDDHTDVSRCAAKCSLKVRKIGSTKRLPCSLLVEYDIMSNISMLNPLGVTLHLMQNIFKKWFSRINQAIMDNKNHFFFPYAVCVCVSVCVCACVAACVLWRVHRAVVQPGEELPAVPHCDHREGVQVEGRRDLPSPANLLTPPPGRRRSLFNPSHIVIDMCVCVFWMCVWCVSYYGWQ